ncbi:MAG: hypothetical protein HC763_27140 [Hydrococcus sp. CRU_1_1]|nr:hypothetical protein [Hydrococcus sp. CRU_1_1]
MSGTALLTSLLGVTPENEKIGLYNSYPGLVELFTTNTQETKNISTTWDNLWYDAFNVNGLAQGVGGEVLFWSHLLCRICLCHGFFAVFCHFTI